MPIKQPPEFTGFRPAALEFLRGLSEHNEKPWFEAHRAEYEREVKAPVAALIGAVTTAMAQRELPLEGDPKRSSFRINRDIRFSNDKRPYKTELGVVWYRQGSGKDGAGIVYFHLSPNGCFAAAAFYLPDPEVLASLREAIRVRPDAFLGAREALAQRGLTLSTDDTLSRMPRGFEDMKDSPVADVLRLKSLVVRRAVEDVTRVEMVHEIVQLARDAMPLLRFGWGAVDEVARATL